MSDPLHITFVDYYGDDGQITVAMPTVPNAGDLVDLSNPSDGFRIFGTVKFRRFFYFAGKLEISVVVEQVDKTPRLTADVQHEIEKAIAVLEQMPEATPHRNSRQSIWALWTDGLNILRRIVK